MAEQTYNSIIKYKTVPVMLDGAFTLKCGLEPDVNSFVVAYDDFKRLLTTADKPGDLEFFFLRTSTGSDARGTSDLRLQNMVMVSWSPMEMGSTPGTTPRSPPTIGPVRWRIRLADFRERFVEPRGGRLMEDGVVNAKSSKTQLSMKELIQKCLTAMGLGISGVPNTVNDVSAPQDLKWLGTHAPTQLDELLDRTGAVAVPHRDGRLTIELIGSGATPQVPQGRELPVVPLGAQDRRGRTVVFTSFPNAIVERSKLKGPSDDAWQYVAPDPIDGIWKKLNDIPLLRQRPIQMFRDAFKDVPQGYREHFDRNVFHCLRLNPLKYGATPLLRLARHWHIDSSTGAGVVDDLPIRVVAKKYVNLRNGYFANPPEAVLVNPTTLDYGAILRFDSVMMKLESDRPYLPDIRPFLTSLDEGDLVVQFGREERDERTKKLKYFTAGFTLSPSGALQPLSDTDAAAIAANPGRDDVVVERPDWIVYKENNEYSNLRRIKDQAKKEAKRLLKGSGEPAELRSAVGWFPIELSGKVAEIRFTQEPPKTEWRVNTWWVPGEFYLTQTREKSKAKNAGNAMPNQQAAQGERQIIGAAGEVQPSVALNPTAAALPAAAVGLAVKPDTKLSGGWYSGVVSVGQLTATFAPDQPLGRITGDTAPCLICNSLEQDRRSNHVLLGRWYAAAIELKPQDDLFNTRTFMISVDPDVIKDLRYKAPAAGETKGHVQVAFETAPGHDSDWKDKIDTTPCP